MEQTRVAVEFIWKPQQNPDQVRLPPRAGPCGAAMLLISEDLDEILEPAGRIVVMHGARAARAMQAAGADPQKIDRHRLGRG